MYDFRLLNFIEPCSVMQHTMCPGDCSIYSQNESRTAGQRLQCLLGQVGSQVGYKYSTAFQILPNHACICIYQKESQSSRHKTIQNSRKSEKKTKYLETKQHSVIELQGIKRKKKKGKKEREGEKKNLKEIISNTIK